MKEGKEGRRKEGRNERRKEGRKKKFIWKYLKNWRSFQQCQQKSTIYLLIYFPLP
jgi:hypothetical protein